MNGPLGLLTVNKLIVNLKKNQRLMRIFIHEAKMVDNNKQ